METVSVFVNQTKKKYVNIFINLSDSAMIYLTIHDPLCDSIIISRNYFLGEHMINRIVLDISNLDISDYSLKVTTDNGKILYNKNLLN